jgi:hypothetical protein
LTVYGSLFMYSTYFYIFLLVFFCLFHSQLISFIFFLSPFLPV